MNAASVSGTVSSALTIRLFGPVQVLLHGQPLPPLRSRKGLWLLALMTLRHDRPVAREWLAGTLWPDMEQKLAFGRLRVILSELRKALGDEGQRLQTPSRHALCLDFSGDTDAVDADVVAFDRAIAAGTIPALERAVLLYRGPLLEGSLEEWIPQERSAREQDCLRALQTLAHAAHTAGDIDTAIGQWRRAISLDPHGEAARRSLMDALAQTGDSNAALQIYREYVVLLKDDPKAVPDEQTTALYQRLRSAARKRASSPVTLPAEAAAVPSVTGYLPHALTEIVGREEERLAVAVRLRRSRLVTLTGPGGIGKTRLALEIAAEVAPEYAGGVWLVALEALSEGAMVAAQIAAVLGIKEALGKSLLMSVTEHLRSKRLLLVLDNREHLLSATAELAEHLLRECAAVRILATSREALGITGETIWAVPGLAVPSVEHLPQGMATLLRVLTGYESVELFVDRAQAVQKTFALMGRNALSVAQICVQLDGIPLAIELAAARVKSMTVEQIAERLKEHHHPLNLLTGGSRTSQARQQTLRGTLDWSYALLTEPEQVLLRRLSVFVGGWTLDAAESVCSGCSGDTVRDLLNSLVEKSLVVFEARDTAADGRYAFLEMVRQYGAEHLETSGEAPLVRAKHRDWFLAFAEATVSLSHDAAREEWTRRLEHEHDNLRAALSWSAGAGADADTGTQDGLRLAAALAPFWNLCGYLEEGRRALERALALASSQARTMTRAKALNGASQLSLSQGEYAATRTLVDEALGIFRELGDQEGIASALRCLGTLVSYQGDYTIAWELYEESLGLSRQHGDKKGIAAALTSMAGTIRQQGDYAASQALLEESLLLRRELKDSQGIALTLSNLGNVLRLQGQHDLARTLLEESVEIRQELGDKIGLAWCLSALGSVALWLGEFDRAQALHEQSLHLRRELGEHLRVGWALTNLGTVAYSAGQMTAAKTRFTESLEIFRGLGSRGGVAAALVSLGRVECVRGDILSARALTSEGFGIHLELKDTEAVAEGLMIGAELRLAQGQALQAVRLWGAAHTLRRHVGISLAPYEQAAHEGQMAQAVSQFGADAFSAEWEAGEALTWEQAIVLARDESPTLVASLQK